MRADSLTFIIICEWVFPRHTKRKVLVRKSIIECSKEGKGKGKVVADDYDTTKSHRDGRDDDDGKYCKKFYVFRIVVAIVLPIRLLRLSMREGKERKKTLRWRYFSCMRLSTNKCAEKLQQNPLTERPAHTHRHTVNAHVHTATKREDFQEGERSHLAFDLHSQSWTRERDDVERGFSAYK